jgi:hypothetical protein
MVYCKKIIGHEDLVKKLIHFIYDDLMETR